jgi:hypothetical protein
VSPDKLLPDLFPFLAGVIFSAGGLVVILRVTRRDVNGLGRKFWRSVAYQLRCLAEEEPISKRKLMNLADLIEPK